MLGEELVHIALDDAGLAHAELADDQHLEEVLAGLGPRGRPPARPVMFCSVGQILSGYASNQRIRWKSEKNINRYYPVF